MLKNIENIQFFDIETTSQYSTFKELETKNEALSKVWVDKYVPRFKDEEDVNGDFFYTEKSGLYPEFGKIICVSFLIYKESEGWKAYTFNSESEVEILTKISLMFKNGREKGVKWLLGGFNIKQFDIPYLFKRYVINNLNLPQELNFEGKKPWEIELIDVYDIWKYSSFVSTSLEALSVTLGVSNPKAILEEKTVHELYYSKEFDLIKNYCEGDCAATKNSYEKIFKSIININ